MGRTKTSKYAVKNASGAWIEMYAPDQDQEVSYEDIDRESSGRTEDGVMHRNVARYKIGSWSFSYGVISAQEKNEMENMFGNRASFMFRHPSRTDDSQLVETKCYRSKVQWGWKDILSGDIRNYSFNIIEC